MIWGSNPGRGRRLSPMHPHILQGPLRMLLIGYQRAVVFASSQSSQMQEPPLF